MPGADVFISYRREDAGDAGRLGDWLGVRFGPDRVFRDVTGIRGGDEFPDVIREAVRNCTAVVALVTPNWPVGLGDPGDWVRRELSEALAADKPVVPVLLRGAPPPQQSELPAELAALADRNAIAVSDTSFRGDIGRVIDALERLGVPAASVVVFPEIPKTAREEARAGWYAADDPEHARSALVSALSTHGIRVTGEQDGDLLLQGGSKGRTRLLGAFFVREQTLPLTGRLRIDDHGASVAIEVLLAESWGRGAFTGIGGRYSSRFDKIVADLRRATTRG